MLKFKEQVDIKETKEPAKEMLYDAEIQSKRILQDIAINIVRIIICEYNKSNK